MKDFQWSVAKTIIICLNVVKFCGAANVWEPGNYHLIVGVVDENVVSATDIANRENCYKIMLMTGSKKEGTLNFYRKNSFDSSEKTAFILRL